MKSVAVFCASSEGKGSRYVNDAYEFGVALAKNNCNLVYGGASIGLMGQVAKGVMDAGSKVVGVLPRFLQKREITKFDITELILVDTMHKRKEIMANRSDAFVAIPGGIGTLEELFEVMTWQQIDLHDKKVAIYNPFGYYNNLIAQLKLMVEEGMLNANFLSTVIIESDRDTLLKKLLAE